jgi:catechol 2,3-dioxygenase-like lactoylglutathione lyase family enzyme
MKIKLNSVIVHDQEKALRFYTDVLGFVKDKDIPVGQYRWLTVISPEGHDDVELLLEPDENLDAKAYQRALYGAGIPLTAFATDDVQEEYRKLKDLGVVFQSEPVVMGETTIAVFDDTCGNLIQIYQD